MAEMNQKLYVFKDPYLSTAEQTESLLKDLKESADKVRDQERMRNDLERQRDDLETTRLENQGASEL